MEFPAAADLLAGLTHIRLSPSDDGTVELIARRPAVGSRDELEAGELDLEQGLVGDSWRTRPSGTTADGSANPDMQLTLMNVRCIALLAGHRDRWSLAGDQLYVDLDLSLDNLPAGSRLGIGDAVIEVTEPPHTGCGKFSRRFGADALRFVNSEAGRRLRLRGLNARVVSPGVFRRGDRIAKV